MTPRLTDVLRRLVLGAGLVFAFLLVAFFVYPHYGVITSLVLMFIVTFTLVRAYAMGYRYRCAHCHAVFKVPLAVDFLTFSGMGRNPDGTFHTWKSLTCPSCGQRTRAIAVRVETVDEAEVVGEDAGRRRRAAAAEKRSAAQRRGGRKRS